MKKAGKFEVGLMLFILAIVAAIMIPAVISEMNREEICPIDFNDVVQIKVKSEKISYYTGEPESWQGTGVFIADDLILTAGHVVDDANSITIVLANGKEYVGGDWYKETEVDLGIIRVFTPEKECTPAFDNAVIGEEVWALGSPFGTFPVLTKGIISAIDMPDTFKNQKNMLITDAATNGGNSGSPLIDEDGKILGICSWGYVNSQGMSYFVRAEICELVINKYFAIKALEEVK